MQTSKNKKTVKDYLKVGNKRKKEGKIEPAIDQYQKALQIEPNFVPAISQLAEIYEQQKEFDKALHYRQQASKLRPKNVLLKARLARTMMKVGQTNRGLAIYQKAMKISEELPSWAYKDLCHALVQNGQLEEAIQVYNKLLVREPYNYSYQRQKAQSLIKLGHLDEAYQGLSPFLNNNPNYNLIKTFYLGVVTPKRYKQEALDILEKLYNENSIDIKSLVNRAILAKQLGYLDKAESYLNKALALEPDNPSVLLEMANILKSKNKRMEAIVYQKKAKPDNNFVKFLESLYETDKVAFNSELIRAIETSTAIQFIKDKILSQLNIKYKKHLILYLPSGNVGDTCKLLALIKPLCIQHNKKAIVFYPDSPSPVIQAKLFLEPIMPKYVVCHFAIDSKTIQTIKNLNDKDKIHLDQIPIRAGIPIMMSNKKLNYLIEEAIYKRGKAATLGIKIELNDDTIGKPVINTESLDKALKKFNNLNLIKGKSILIAPHGVTVDKHTGSNAKAAQFWQQIIRQLLKRKITPVINAVHRDSSVAYLSEIFTDEQIKFAELSLDEVIPFVEFCGAFAGVRSGLCDLIAFASKKVVKLCVEPKNSAGSYFKKLPDTRVIDNTIINDNFEVFHLSVNDSIEDAQIRKIVNLFLKNDEK